jgi:hypothetical protein
MLSDYKDLNSLSNLLAESQEAYDALSETHNQRPVASAPSKVVVNTGSKATIPAEKAPTTNIWDAEEIPTEDSLAAANDSRPCPRYEFCYKQSVGTEDTMLGLGDKTPLTADCTDLVVKVHFPGSTMRDLDLDVTPKRIRVSSKTHKLFTYLPVTVDDINGNAKFDSKKEVLIITLPIVQEF